MLPILLCLTLGLAPDFDTEVLPVLTKSGCNAGACHGAAIGRGGFKLSLWGGDPASDYDAIVNELEGRRINLARPDESLLLLKPTGYVEHGGEIRLEDDGPGERIIAQWLSAGATRSPRRRLIEVDVQPRRLVLKQPGNFSIHVGAIFDDGTRQDVTEWSVLTANDPAAVKVGDAGQVEVVRRGQQVVIVRFLDQVTAVELMVPLTDRPLDLSSRPRRNFVDEHVLHMLATLRLPPSLPAEDAAFLRRLRLDLTGTLPSSAEVRAFLAESRPDKRSRLIERLLASDDFITFWTHSWARLLQLDSARMDIQGVAAFQDWLRLQVASNAAWDQMATALLTAEGDSFSVGPANFARATAGPREQAEHVSQALMGVRLRCANCHNHPLDRWTQDDYHGLAAIFARLERGRVVKVGPRGEVTHPRTDEPAVPRLPGERLLEPGGNGRGELARWLTAANNPYFARAAVNRLWKAMFGRGLVEPVDDLRDTNPATHPALLKQLADDFVQHGYDPRHTLRLIATSSTYAQSAQTTSENAADDLFYSHALVRPLPAAVLLDAWSAVTEAPGRYGDLPPGSRAIELVDASVLSPSLDLLGRCSPGTDCGQSSGVADLARALHLINGNTLNEKLLAESNALGQQISAGHTDIELLEEFYLRSLSRFPTQAESDHWWQALSGAGTLDERRAIWTDLLWGLLSCREFVTNH